MVVAILVYSFDPAPEHLRSSSCPGVVLIPVIAGLCYEVIRFAAKNMQRRWVRVSMKPGLLLQKLTTREPDLDQLEVAITSLRAVMTAEQLAEVEARPRRGRFLHSAPRHRSVSPPAAYRTFGRPSPVGGAASLHDGAGPEANASVACDRRRSARVAMSLTLSSLPALGESVDSNGSLAVRQVTAVPSAVRSCSSSPMAPRCRS